MSRLWITRISSMMLGLGLALVVGVAPASAAGKLKVDSAVGSALLNDGTKAEITVDCPTGNKNCRGDVALLPRGDTAGELGDDPIAEGSFKADAGTDADIRMGLTGPARRALEDDPLLVTAVVDARGSKKPSDEQRVSIVEAREIEVDQVPTAVRQGDQTVFSWNFQNIRAGTYLILKQFWCPSYAPYVGAGGSGSRQGGPTEFVAKIDYKASDGVGYAGFDHANVSEAYAPGVIYAFTSSRAMFGWKEGGFWENSIWAPGGETGRFSFSVTCTPNLGGGSSAVNGSAYVQAGDERADSRRFFPWRN